MPIAFSSPRGVEAGFLANTPKIGAIVLACFIGQLLAGTGFGVATLLTLAVLFGTLSVFAAGGFDTATGMLNAIILAKFLLFGLAVKIVLLEPSEANLHTPQTTSMVMVLGFLGLWVGTLIFRFVPKPRRTVAPNVTAPGVYLVVTVVIIALGIWGFVVAVQGAWNEQTIQVGGIYGVARAVFSLKALAVATSMLYVWASGRKRFLSHPIVVTTLAIALTIGVLSTNKQDTMEPLLYFVFVALLRRGLSYKPMWATLIGGLLLYVAIVYPYSEYIRFSGGRVGTLSHRTELVQQTIGRYLTDSDFRSTVSSRVSGIEKGMRLYWGERTLMPLSRFAMIAYADQLVFATEEMRSYTGWETITWGFRMLLPRALAPDKPVYAAGNRLGRIAGDANQWDHVTQYSYGEMANFYNAFGFVGVALGTPILFACFYYLLHVLFGNLRWVSNPMGGTVWLVFVIVYYQHNVVECSVSALMQTLPILLLPIAIFYGCQWFINGFRHASVVERLSPRPVYRP